MKVILLKDIPKLGKKNEIKDISDGYAQNALLPKKLVQIATPEAIKAVKENEERAKLAQIKEIEEINNTISYLQNQKFSIELPANDQGHLFSKFKIEQLKKLFKDKGVNFDTKHIVPFEFKEVGVHKIKVKLPQNINAEFEIYIKGI